MKKIFITILLAALMPFAAGAQDARQRTAETIVADALAQLPAQTPKAFDSLMQELAAPTESGRGPPRSPPQRKARTPPWNTPSTGW